MGDWTKKVGDLGDLGDLATNKVGDGRFGSKMGEGTGRLGKYALGAWKIGRKKSGRLGDSDPPSRASIIKTYRISI